jgi:glycosyltransferase involved in cell wall biosynthesis
VIIPFYNTPVEYFAKTLDSIARQSVSEVILVDDCSTDQGTIRLAKSTGYKYIKTPFQSGGDGMPFRIGVEYAKGDYVCKMDSDDILLSIPSQIEYDFHLSRLDRAASSVGLDYVQMILAPRPILNGSIFKRELLLKYPSPDDHNVYNDILLSLRLLYNKHTFSVSDKVSCIYTSRPNSLQTSETISSLRLRHMQTVARFCAIEKMGIEESHKLMSLAMLNLQYGSNALKFLKKGRYEA